MNRRTTTLLATALVFALLPSSPALAETTGATIDKTGWWNRANTTTSSPAGPVTVPPPPGVPEGDLVVGALEGEPSAVLAIGIQPDEGPGATVQRFTLQLTEDSDAGGNQNTDAAAIRACPITAFWAGGANGDWETRPTVDCEAASATGERDENGVWTFDLAPIGELWFDTFGTIRADGVRLEPVIDETPPFQAVFLGGDDIDVVLEADPAPDDEDPFAAPAFEDPPSDAGFNTGGSGDGGSIFSPPVVAAPPTTSSFEVPTADVGTEPPPVTDHDGGGGGGETAAPRLVDSPAAESAASRAGDVFGNLSPLVLLGMLAFVGVLVVMSYWLGPAGQPVTTVRQRGVSRALEARRRLTKGS
jgi:hypothetical protein